MAIPLFEMGISGKGGIRSHAGNVEGSHVLESKLFDPKRAGMYLDSPSYTLGDAIQYRIGLRNEATSATIYVGRTSRDNTLYHPRTASILICMEVAG